MGYFPGAMQLPTTVPTVFGTLLHAAHGYTYLPQTSLETPLGNHSFYFKIKQVVPKEMWVTIIRSPDILLPLLAKTSHVMENVFSFLERAPPCAEIYTDCRVCDAYHKLEGGVQGNPTFCDSVHFLTLLLQFWGSVLSDAFVLKDDIIRVLLQDFYGKRGLDFGDQLYLFVEASTKVIPYTSSKALVVLCLLKDLTARPTPDLTHLVVDRCQQILKYSATRSSWSPVPANDMYVLLSALDEKGWEKAEPTYIDMLSILAQMLVRFDKKDLKGSEILTNVTGFWSARLPKNAYTLWDQKYIVRSDIIFSAMVYRYGKFIDPKSPNLQKAKKELKKLIGAHVKKMTVFPTIKAWLYNHLQTKNKPNIPTQFYKRSKVIIPPFSPEPGAKFSAPKKICQNMGCTSEVAPKLSCGHGCKTRYCSKKCQKEDWTHHKNICKKLSMQLEIF